MINIQEKYDLDKNMTGVIKINERQKNQKLVNEFTDIKINFASTKEYYANYKKNTNETLATFNNQMSDILKRSIQRLDNIGLQIRECVNQIGNQEKVYLKRSSLNGENGMNLKNKILLNIERNLSSSPVMLNGENFMDKVINQLNIDHPSSECFKEDPLKIQVSETSYYKSPNHEHKPIKTHYLNIKKKSARSSRKLKYPQSRKPQIQINNKTKKLQRNITILSATPLIMTSSRRKSESSNSRRNSKQEEAIIQQIKQMHKRDSIRSSKADEQSGYLPEKSHSTLKLLQSKYTMRPKRRNKKKLIDNKYSCQVFVPKTYTPSQRVGRKLSYYKPPVLQVKVSHGSIFSAKKQIKENNLTRKYATENFWDKSIRTIKSEISYKGETIKLNESKPDWCIIMNTQKPEKTRYELKQNSVLKSTNILDEITLKDLTPLKAEYPRKDNIATYEMPLNETLLYKLVNDTKSLEYLVNTKRLEKIRRKLRRSRIIFNNDPIPEEEDTICEQVPEKTVQNLRSEEVRKRLKKYIIDPTRNYSQSITVMPVLVNYDKDTQDIKNIYKNVKLQQNNKKAISKSGISENDPFRQTITKSTLGISPKSIPNKQRTFLFNTSKSVVVPNKKSPTSVQKVLNSKKPLAADKPKKLETPQLTSFFVNNQKNLELNIAMHQTNNNKLVKNPVHKNIISADNKIKNDRSDIKNVIDKMEDKYKKAINGRQVNRYDIFDSLKREMKDILSNLPIESKSQVRLAETKSHKLTGVVKSSPTTKINQITTKNPTNTQTTANESQAVVQKIEEVDLVQPNLNYIVENKPTTMCRPKSAHLEVSSTSEGPKIKKVASDKTIYEKDSNIGVDIKTETTTEEISQKEFEENKKNNTEDILESESLVTESDTTVSIENLDLTHLELMPTLKEISPIIEKPCDLTMKNDYSQVSTSTCTLNTIFEDKVMNAEKFKKKCTTINDQITKQWEICEFIENEVDYEEKIKPSPDLLKIKPEEKTIELKMLEKELGNEMRKFCSEINEVIELIKPISSIDDEDDFDDEITPRNQEMGELETLSMKKSEASVKQLATESFLVAHKSTALLCESESDLNISEDISQNSYNVPTFNKTTENERISTDFTIGHEESDLNIRVDKHQIDCNFPALNKELLKKLLLKSDLVKITKNGEINSDFAINHHENYKNEDANIPNKREAFCNIMLISLYTAVFATVFFGLNLKYQCLS